MRTCVAVVYERASQEHPEADRTVIRVARVLRISAVQGPSSRGIWQLSALS
jgi:hypothetical protein